MKMEDNENQGFRLLKIFDLLQHGKTFTKSALAEEFGVSTKTIQRDIGKLNCFFESSGESYGAICYDSQEGTYNWQHDSDILFNEDEIVVLAAVLLESRALPKKDLCRVIDKLTVQCAESKRKRIKKIISNELHHYTELQNAKNVGKAILDLSEAKQEQHLVELVYRKVGALKDRTILVKPVGIMFAEFYFYFLGMVEGGIIPITFRIDRIKSYRIVDESFAVDYKERFQEGEFRNEIQMMNTGTLADVKFRFWGRSLEAVRDKLPNARIIKQEGEVTTLEARVYLRGAKMWFLSQAEFLEILEPESFREEMAATIKKMLDNYK